MRGTGHHQMFKGTICFASESAGDCQAGEVSRAILRPKALVFDCLTSEGEYSVRLDLHSKGRCNGKWWYVEDGEEYEDIVQARLYKQGSALALIGEWREQGGWRWFAELVPATGTGGRS